MAIVQDPTVLRHRLRLELRRARDAAKLRQADVAGAMDWSPSKLIRIEKGDVGISTNDLKALLSYYDVTEKKRVDELLELARASRGASFYDQYVDLLKPGFKEYLAYESSASVISQYDPIRVPGLLQTEEYARALFAGYGTSDPNKAERGWEIRRHRQEAVYERDRPPLMVCIIDEAALRRQVGGPSVMRHQLERLLAYANESYITILILPFALGAHPGMARGMVGTFILLEFEDPNLDDLVHLESIDAITIRDNTDADTDKIARYLDEFEHLKELALSAQESKGLLENLIEEMSPAPHSINSASKGAV